MTVFSERLLYSVFLVFSGIACTARISGAASPAADAGPNQIVAPRVPIILDGSGSTDPDRDALLFSWWSSPAGEVEIVGFDRRYAIMLAPDDPGLYTINLTVSDGTSVDSDSFSLTVAKPQGQTFFVDGALPADVLNGQYSIARRDNSGGDGNAFKSLQDAADAVQPGDEVLIRGGSYEHDNFLGQGVYVELMHIERSGTPTAPIRFEAYADEHVTLVGVGFDDRDLNGDGLADGVPYSAKRTTLLRVDGDYIQVKGLRCTNGQRLGFALTGNFCLIEECVAYDNFSHNFSIFKSMQKQQGNIFRNVEGYRSRHGSGFALVRDASSQALTTCNAVIDSLFYDNGYQPNGNKVLPIGGDPAGGGNSDGILTDKNFHDKAVAVDNFGPNNFIVGVIAYHNADDGIDLSLADSLIERNISFDNGPEGRRGFKVLREVRGLTFRANVAYRCERGFEVRPPAGEVVDMYNNTSLGHTQHGMIEEGGGGLGTFANNVSGNNNGVDYWFGGQWMHNWSEDGTGVPPDSSGDIGLVQEALVIDTMFPSSLRTVAERAAHVRAQVRAAFVPDKISPLIDAGVVIPGYHCERADDDPVNPMPLTAPGRHWRGAAPDIGAFESGTSFTPYPPPGNVDGTRLR